MRFALALVLASLTSLPARACETALVLAIDVSNSIDNFEYDIQATGLADALRDPLVMESLVTGRVALAVVQWSGPKNQEVSIPWRHIASEADVLSMADEAETMPRAVIMANTAIGDTIAFASALFADVPECKRKVIDISGDGADNAGTVPEVQRRIAETQGITINGLAIDPNGIPITNYYRMRVITRNGFVMTARGHGSYAETLKEKIRREVAQVMF
ncbi:MAG: DUF1194 domain-containing protein [Pseudomonadota bacterium]